MIWECCLQIYITRSYRQISNISRTLVCNIIVYHSWRCSNYIFILNFTRGVNGLDDDSCKTRRETFKICDLVRLMLEILRYWQILNIISPTAYIGHGKEAKTIAKAHNTICQLWMRRAPFCIRQELVQIECTHLAMITSTCKGVSQE